MNKQAKILFILFFIIATAFFSRSQSLKEPGSPLIQNYEDKDYGTDSPQNWSMVQDHRGVMYFGNTEGVLEYDGKTWRLIKVTNSSVIWSLAIDPNGTIYVGAVSEFGYLAPNKNGKLMYVSLLDKIKKEDRDCGDIRDICVTGYRVYFIGSSNIYIYRNSSITVIKTGYSPIRGFLIHDSVYIAQKDNGIFKIQNNKLTLLPFSEELKSDFKEYIILPFCKRNILIGIRDKGFFLYDEATKASSEPLLAKDYITKIHTEVDDYIKTNLLTTGIRLDNERFAIGTLSGGIVIFGMNGDLQQIINKNRGMISNGVYCLYNDRYNNLWAGLVSGIAKIEINSPISKFTELNGLEGLILSVKSFKGRKYVGTTNGIYYMPEYKLNSNNDKFKFQMIKNTVASCWDFFEINNKLFAPGPLGLLEIKDTTAVKINEAGQILTFFRSDKFPDIIFLGTRPGLKALKVKINGEKVVFEEPFVFKEVNTAIWRIAGDRNGDLWISDKYNGLYHLQFPGSKDISKYTLCRYDTSDGLPQMDFDYPFFINNELIVGTQKGVYKVVAASGKKSVKFIPEETFGKILNARQTDVKQIDMDAMNRIWINSYKNGVFFLTKEKNGGYSLYDKIFRKTGYVYRFFIDSDITWICTNHSLIKYNSKIDETPQTNFLCLIRKISIGKDSTLFWGISNKGKGMQTQNEIPSINFSYNSISFKYAAPFFDNEAFTEYCYFLEGFDKGWSNWSKESKKEFTNLHEGTYIFRVKAKNIYDGESAESAYRFKITAPWYRAFWAYALYIILFVLIIYLSIKIYSKRLIDKNIRLETLMNERTSEVQRQKEELELLSLVASKTDNAIAIMDADANFEWINESYKTIYGWDSLEQFISAKGKNLRQNSSSAMINEVLDNCLNNKKAVVYDNLTPTKYGTDIWSQTTLTPILDEKGAIKKIIAIDSDISMLKKAEQEIIAQQDLLAKANNEMQKTNMLITDSIKYSKRIQEAILPSRKFINYYFPEAFVFYKPRDIVSGDFYWMSTLGNKVYFAVVDCTGHGVPGALMSMIGNTILNEIVNEKKISSPTQILELLTLRVVAALEKGREADDIQTDGMDLVLCCWDNDTHELQVASANSYAILFNKKGMQKISGEIYSIGDIFSYNNNVVYVNHKFNVEHGDTLYLYTDGYLDQFGGEENDKFMTAQFEQLLISIQHLTMKEQLSKVSSCFEAWKGANKQTDDVLVMGIRF
ncbi:MAG: SpoIIE family protein phosphatase [Bacteroidia bacterium]|nr:SpoIIE family protein phosphatase [Bacteroidia bacterium]